MGCCGPYMSMFGIILSVWGILQLTILGIMFYFKCLILLPDVIPKETYFEDPEEFYREVDEKFSKTAIRCWLAAALYVLLLLVSLYLRRTNYIQKQLKKAQLKASTRRSAFGVPRVSRVSRISSI